MAKQLTDETKDELRACLVDKKNSDPCISKVLEEHGIPEEDKAKVLQKLYKEDNG